MKQMLNFAFATALLALVGCTAKAPDPRAQTLERTLRLLNLKNPASDAMKNFTKGDLRLIGVNGFSCSLPGRPSVAQEKLAQQNGMYCLDGTSDVGLRDLNEQAAVYSARYNAALVKLIHR
jgi:hypothetical protein